MNIIIKPENKERIEKVLETEQERYKVRKLTYEELVKSCRRCEEYLDSIGLKSKAIKEDIKILIDPCGFFISSDEKTKTWLHGFKLPESTQADITYKNGTWRLTEIDRRATGNKDRYFILFTEKQKYRLIEQFTSFGRKEEAEEEE